MTRRGPQTLAEAVSSGVGIERPFLCPVHADTRPSASVNVILNVWVCYTCGARGQVGGEAMLGEIDFALVREQVEHQLADPVVYPESWLNQFDAAGPGEYWLNRFTLEACEHFRLGVTMEGDPCYPLRNESGQVHGIVRRTDWSRAKYMYPKGIDIGDYLFNFSWRVEDVLVLVEGAADAIAVWEAGYHCFAIYGSRMSTRQIEFIEAVAPGVIVTAFDQDDAGHAAAREVAKRFRRTIVGTWYPQLGDVADMNLETRKKILDRLAYGQRPPIGSTVCESTPEPPSRTLSPGMRPPSWP